jgi:hypothetical protein
MNYCANFTKAPWAHVLGCFFFPFGFWCFLRFPPTTAYEGLYQEYMRRDILLCI